MSDSYVLLDRDGVINYDSDDFIKSPEEWRPIPGSLEAIGKLNAYGYKVIVITNQSGIARGLFSEQTLHAIHTKLKNALLEYKGEIERIYYCPHGPGQNCLCRKPKPGLLQQFSKDYAVDLVDIPFIGDTLKDINAANAVQARPILVKTGKGMQAVTQITNMTVPVFENLYDAANFIISR